MIPVLIIMGFAILVLLASLLMPVRIRGRGAGGSDGDFKADGSIHVMDGVLGLGFNINSERQRLSLYIFSKQLFSFSITPLVKKASKRGGKKKAEGVTEKETIEKPKKSKLEGLKKIFSHGREYLNYAKQAMSVVREIIRFDMVIAHVTLGLGNPALTGMATGFIYAFNEFLPASCSITPSFDFTREIVRGDFNIRLKIHMLAVWKNLYRYGPTGIKTYLNRKRKNNDAVTQEA